MKIIDAVAKNLTHVGFYELNPYFDCDEQSARLGAFFTVEVVTEKSFLNVVELLARNCLKTRWASPNRF
ncbi:MAG: hypothetical protein R3A80_03160 [Bdellovibrionota bacterium]